MIFKWNNKYNTGIASIDEQHQQLFLLGNQLFGVVSSGEGMDNYDKIMAVLDELKNYTAYHFKHEEELMDKFSYKDYEAHKKQHEAFVDKIIEVETKNIDDNQNKITMEIIEFIADWVQNHIVKSDHGYKDLFLEKGVV
ncbi:bacteriohemerythrin [Desulfitibacter alkalitolerans]|uniref:bacteriohemerythrin n=1 Tax=Desulfitibacter alkalitolerans TaxID=264641 RepID=UPI0005512969|nr:bacteriohemerythrin [Desulfitibacter alkalitolerans]